MSVSEEKKYNDIPYPILIVMFTSWGKFTYNLKESLPTFYELVDKYLVGSVAY